MKLSRKRLQALDRMAELAHAESVDVSPVNKRGGSHLIRVAVWRENGEITRRTMDRDGTVGPYQ